MENTGKPYKLEPNIEATLSYVLPPITGIVVLLVEKQNRYVRFHAMQAVFFGVASFILVAIANALISVLIGFILAPLVSISLFLVWLYLMWQAYNNKEYELPILGDLVRKQLNK